MRLLALDFDGVICDSAPEVFTIAVRTYLGLVSGSSLAHLGERLSGERAPAPAEVGSSEAYAAFLDILPLGNRAEDFGVALAAIDAGKRVRDQADYDALRAQRDPEWLRAYHERFYQHRRALAETDPAGWSRLMRPYAPFLEVLRRRRADVDLAIATAKDRWSVRVLLESFGAADLFPEDRVLDKETGENKCAHLEQLQRLGGLDFEEMTFMDDKVNHLDAVAHLGVRCALARWGYNGDREAALARERGYLLCSLEDAESLLFA